MCQTLRLIFASVAQSCSDGLSMDISLVSLNLSLFLFHFYHFPCSRWCEVGQHHRAGEAVTSSLWLWGRGLYRLQPCHSFLLLVFIFFSTPVNYFGSSVVEEKPTGGLRVRFWITVCFQFSKAFQFLHSCGTQKSANGESISLQSQPNPSLEILKIFEHISFGISDPTIYFYSKHNIIGLSLLDQIFKISKTRISHSKWHIKALLAIAGKLICLYKIKLICISQLDCLIQWLLCVCFLYEPGLDPSGLPSPKTSWFIVNQINIASNVHVWARRFGWRTACLDGSKSCFRRAGTAVLFHASPQKMVCS